MRKSYAHLEYLIWKQWKVDKANKKIFQFNFQAFSSLQLVSCFTQVFCIFGSLFYSWKNYFLGLCLGDMINVNHTFTVLLRCKDTILTKSSLFCQSFVKFTQKCKSLASNCEPIPTYWPLKNTLKRINCLDEKSLMSYKKHLNDEF